MSDLQTREQMLAGIVKPADILDLLGKVDHVQYKTGWQSKHLAADAIREIARLRTSLSEAEQQVQDARLQTQAMHRRAQESERVEQMIFDTLGTWFRLYNEGRFKPRAKRTLFFVVLKELKARAEKIRGRRALIPSEPHNAEGRE